ncbi:MAG TPA: protein kinase, partial [Steroidobacteraceae bacterium]|nr:protein kinase [Steroidobacteraceae bacterium]
RKAQQLAHPNIVTVYDFDRDGANVFIVMELLQGQPLDRVIKQLGSSLMPTTEALRIVKEMGKALSYAHEKGVIHLDFKPANAFVGNDGGVKILDFGIARAQQRDDLPENEKTLFQVGDLGALTPSYATVEMVNGGDPDPRDDLYALACVTYELLAGKHPYGRQSAQFALEYNLVPMRPKGLARARWQALQRALALHRADRTPSVAQFIDELTRIDGAWALRSGIAAAVVAAAAVAYWQWPEEARPSRDAAVPSQMQTAPVAGLPSPAPTAAEQASRDERIVSAAEIEARQRERVLQLAKANEVEAAVVMLNELREELPPGDSFIAREGPLAIALAYLRLTEGALQKIDYAAAGEYVAAAGHLGADLRVVKESRGALAEISKLDGLIRTGRELSGAELQGRFATIKAAFPNAYPAVERNLASVLAARIERDQKNKSPGAAGLLASGMQAFGHLPSFVSLTRVTQVSALQPTPPAAVQPLIAKPESQPAAPLAATPEKNSPMVEPANQEAARQAPPDASPIKSEPEPQPESKPKKNKPNVIVTF